jgi:hypothetical protein
MRHRAHGQREGHLALEDATEILHDGGGAVDRRGTVTSEEIVEDVLDGLANRRGTTSHEVDS